MGLRFNPPPGWPPAPEGFTPEPGWQPDPSWPPPPPGWQLWVNDDQPPQTGPPQAWPSATGGQPGPPDYGTGTPYPGYPTGTPYPGYATGTPYPGYATGTPYPGYATGTPQPGYPTGIPYPGAGTPAPSAGTSGWAVASLIFGLIGGVLLSAIFGFVALSRIKRLGQRGRGMAIAGIALSGVWLLVIVAAVVAAALGTASRSPSGRITHKGSLDVFSLKTGDCFDNPAGAQSLSSVTAIPCGQPHNAQVYASFTLAGSDNSYPGSAGLTKLARQGCRARTGSVDRSKVTGAMTLRYLYPEPNSWADGHRTVSCLIVNPTADLRSSLLKP